MRIKFDRTGTDRKELAKAMGEILGVKPRYLGMPTAAYEVGCFCIDRNGTVEFDGQTDSGEAERLLEGLADRGIVAAPAETAQAWLDARKAGQEGQETATAGPEEAPGNSKAAQKNALHGAGMGLTVAMPRESFTDAALENLQKLVDSKGGLIKKALAVDSLPIEADGEKVSFPWFTDGQDSDSVRAYTHFITAICDMARNQKRVTAREKPADNEKYAFRCFLLRLGFIGSEYKGERKILLKNLSGSPAYKNGVRKEADGDEISG